MLRRFAGILIASAMALGFAQAASAAVVTYTYNLNYSNTAVFPNGYTYATVTISQDGTGPVTFTVTPIPSTFYNEVSNFGIADFSFMVKGTNPTDADIGQPAGWTISYGTTADGFGRFDVNLAGGGTRYDPLVFTIDNANINNFCIKAAGNECLLDETALTGNPSNPEATPYYFAAHIAGIEGRGENSFWVAGGDPGDEYRPPVPLPASAWLLGSALLGLAGIGRRRRRAA